MRRHTHHILLVIVTLALYSCGETKTTETTTTNTETIVDKGIAVTQAQFQQSKMEISGLVEKAFPTVVTVNGMIDVPPENRAVVNTTMGGYIKTTPLLIGDKVRKGQVLVTIENPEFVTLQQRYMEVNAQLTYLKAEYDRQIAMQAENITSPKSYLKAESAYKTAIATHTGLEKQLCMLNISPATVRSGKISATIGVYAPISGSITAVNVTKGAYVSPATEIIEIIDNDHIHLELSVFEKDIMQIKKGQGIDFKIPEASQETYKAEVLLVGTSIEKNRTIKVHGHLKDESSDNFLVGMFVEAQIITDSAFAKALPSEAIVIEDDMAYVLLLDKKEGNTYSFIKEEVKIKSEYNGFSIVESKKSFKPKSQFLTKGAFSLLGE